MKSLLFLSVLKGCKRCANGGSTNALNRKVVGFRRAFVNRTQISDCAGFMKNMLGQRGFSQHQHES